MLSGPVDTLLNNVTGEPVSHRLREIPIEVDDANANGTFDEGDAVLVYMRGTSWWKPLPTQFGKVAHEFSADPYSFTQDYFLTWEGTGKGSRLATGLPRSRTIESEHSVEYLRAEQDAATGHCDPSGRLDEETGYNWYWFWKGNCSPSSSESRIFSGSQLNSERLASLPGYAGDSVQIGFFEFRGNSAHNFKVTDRQGETLPYFSSLDSLNQGVKGSWYETRPKSGRFEIDKVEWTGSNRMLDGYSVVYKRRLQTTPLACRYIASSKTAKTIAPVRLAISTVSPT
jgi:hypothetical protein